jgi:hypothetical protein
MTQTMITAAQLKRLQVLWGQYARREMIKNSREERLSWANENLRNRALGAQRLSCIASFKELTLAEASGLINALQSILGVKESSPAVRPRRFRSRIKDRDLAHAAGTEGRRGSRSKLTIASTEDLGMIDAQLTDMGWTRDRLDAFLSSPSSPLRGGSNQLRTIGQINRVLWALKGIAKHQAKAEAQK